MSAYSRDAATCKVAPDGISMLRSMLAPVMLLWSCCRYLPAFLVGVFLRVVFLTVFVGVLATGCSTETDL